MKWLRSGQVAWSEFHLSGNGVNQELWQSLDATCRGTAG
jgi:hypothetical protein